MSSQIHYDPITMEPIVFEEQEPAVVPTVNTSKSKIRCVAEESSVIKGKTAIIILAWNQLEYTKLCIESIKRHTDRSKYELIVVDQGSTDGTLDYLKGALDGDRDTIIWNVKNRGFSGGNNQGLRLAECEFVLMLNNDCEIQGDNWLDLLLNASKESGVGLVGAVCMKVAPNYARRMFDFVGPGKESEKWSYIEGWCLFGKRDLFLELGGFDMRFNPTYSEDTDLSFRIKAKGLKIKAIDVPIKHYGSKTKGQIDASFSGQSDKSSRRLFKKWIQDVEEGEQCKPTILVRRKGAKGDVLLTTPIIRELKKKYPESFLVYATDCPDVLANNPYVDQTKPSMPVSSEYDIVLSPRYEKAMGKNAIDAMAEQCGVKLSSKQIEVYVSSEQSAWAKNKLDSSKQHIAFHTGRAWECKEWPIERFKQVASHYLDKGYAIVELGDRQTRYMGLGKDCRGCSILQAAALIKECDVFLGIDSVCAHLAKAVGTPACVIYGCVDPSTVASDAIEYPIWVEELECKGCRGRTSAEWVKCSQPEVYCLTRITPARVIETVDKCIREKLSNKRRVVE